MRNFDAFIFDIDGTLTSTNELIFASFNHVAEKYLNKKFTNEEIISLFGPSEEVILKSWMKDYFEEAKKDYYNFYSSKHSEMVDVYPGIIEVIRLIKSKGLPLAIFTGKGKKTTEITLKFIEVDQYFDMIITSDDVKEHKPSPEGINKFIDHFNLQRSRVLMIGDSPADILASKKAGIKIASVVWDSYAKDEVLSMDSDYIFYTVDELKEFVKKNI
ncbi:HAD family hydrolase [Melioribacteraceae bacterium 4301-Me]|uniref:HAD family hydrolase n=1 Tax=Pyranulibacter aquaticus TaxID=3163344 RepID=UPI0035972B7E